MKIIKPFYPWLILIIFIFNPSTAQESTAKNNSIKISKENREVRIDGSFNISKGILEFISASNKTPRDYESLFLLNAKPSQIQNALIEIGLNPCFEKKESCSNLEISVTWEMGKIQITRNISEFIELNQADNSLKDLQWVFTGRAPIKDGKEGEISEDKNGETIALQPGIAGIIHPNIDFGNPYDENQQKGFRIKELIFKELMANGQLPKTEELKQTKLVLIIKPTESKKESKK